MKSIKFYDKMATWTIISFLFTFIFIAAFFYMKFLEFSKIYSTITIILIAISFLSSLYPFLTLGRLARDLYEAGYKNPVTLLGTQMKFLIPVIYFTNLRKLLKKYYSNLNLTR